METTGRTLVSALVDSESGAYNAAALRSGHPARVPATVTFGFVKSWTQSWLVRLLVFGGSNLEPLNPKPLGLRVQVKFQVYARQAGSRVRDIEIVSFRSSDAEVCLQVHCPLNPKP